MRRQFVLVLLLSALLAVGLLLLIVWANLTGFSVVLTGRLTIAGFQRCKTVVQ